MWPAPRAPRARHVTDRVARVYHPVRAPSCASRWLLPPSAPRTTVVHLRLADYHLRHFVTVAVTSSRPTARALALRHLVMRHNNGWVTDKCADCRFVYDPSQSRTVQRDIRERVAQVVAILRAREIDLRSGRRAGVCSPLEYACHLRPG